MKAKSIKILLSLFVCMFVIPMSPVSALEDEDLLNTVAVKEQHYETSEYGAIVNSLEKSYSKGAGSLTVVSNFSLTKSLKTLIISMLLSFFIPELQAETGNKKIN